MLIYILDKNLNPLSILEDHTTLLWIERYDSSGEFELTLELNSEYLSDLKIDGYLENRSVDTLMVIETIQIETRTDSDSSEVVRIKGRTLDIFLSRRVVYTEMILTGTIQEVIGELLDAHILNPVNAKRKVDNFLFEQNSDPFLETCLIDEIVDGTDLLSAIQSLLSQHDLGYKVKLIDGNFVFSIYNGVDRSDEGDNQPVIFSESFDNLFESNHLDNPTGYKSLVYIRNYEDTIPFIRHDLSGLDLREGFLRSSAYDYEADPGDPPVPPDPPSLPPAPPAPPSLPPPPELPKNEINYRLKGVYIATTMNRVLACGNIMDGVDQVWADITPDDTPSFNIWQAQVDWLTGSLFLGTGSSYYRALPTFGTDEKFTFNKMTRWIDAIEYNLGGNPSENQIYGLGVNPATGEAIVFVTNPVLTGYEWQFDVYSGTVDGLVLVGRTQMLGNMVSANGNPITTIGNGVVVVTYLVNSFHGGKLRISKNGGSSFLPHNHAGSIPYTEWFDQTWHMRPDPLGNVLFYSQMGGMSALTKSENLGDSASRLGGPNSSEAYGIAINPTATKIAAVINGRQSISIDGGSTFTEEGTANGPTGRKRGFVWSGYDEEDNDLWLSLCFSDPYLSGSKDTIYASNDDLQTYSEIGSQLKDALIQGGGGVDSQGNPLEKPLRMWVLL